MYHATSSLPAILPSQWYTDADFNQREAAALRGDGWQLVAAASQLANPGDYVAMDCLGLPLVVRNHDGELVAFQNVCAHRQCQLVPTGQGTSDEFKCPYHGWRYGADGRTRKIPEAKNFPHFDREKHRLTGYPVHQIGQLVFVDFAVDKSTTEPPDSRFALPEKWLSELAARTNSDDWRLVLSDELSYPCDWKIPIEGSLESYHLSEVHSETFGTDPGETASTHELFPWGTRFATDARDDSFLAGVEERVMRYLVGNFGPDYHHVHAFPNIMASFTDTMSLVYQITPVVNCATNGRGGGTPQSKLRVFGFTRKSKRSGPLGRLLSRGLGRSAASMAQKVLAEDAAIFPKVQAGMNAAVSHDHQTPERIFGRCEERLHAFHVHWNNQMKRHGNGQDGNHAE